MRRPYRPANHQPYRPTDTFAAAVRAGIIQDHVSLVVRLDEE
jgi:hypothetical protein